MQPLKEKRVQSGQRLEIAPQKASVLPFEMVFLGGGELNANARESVLMDVCNA